MRDHRSPFGFSGDDEFAGTGGQIGFLLEEVVKFGVIGVDEFTAWIHLCEPFADRCYIRMRFTVVAGIGHNDLIAVVFGEPLHEFSGLSEKGTPYPKLNRQRKGI